MSAATRLLSRILSWALLAAVVAAGLALIVVPKATGSTPLTVLSGSMAPAYDPGDVVIVRPTDSDQLRVGDVITFQPASDDPRLTTHRIETVVFGSEGRQFVTWGDANGAADPEPVSAEQVRGKVWYSVPLVGRVSVWLAGGWLRDLVDLVALALLLHGGWLVLAGLRERRRTPSVA